MTRVVRFVLQLVGVMAITAILLLVIELAAGRFIEAPTATKKLPPEIPGDTVSRTLTYLEVNPAPLARDVDLLWRNEPNARKTQPMNPQMFGHNDEWTIENNSEGYRGPERDRNAGDDVYRVLCIGDSVTFGFNIDQPGAYPRQLQALLEGRYPGRRFEVVNAAVPGWTWLQGLRFLELEGLGLRPSAIVMGHGTNDQFLPARVTDEERFHQLDGPFARTVRSFGVWLTHTNTYRAVERVLPPPSFSPDRDSPGCQEQIRQFGGCRRVSVDQIAAAVGKVATITADHSIDLLVINLDFVRTAAVTGVRRTTEQRGLPFLNAVEAVGELRLRDETARAERLGLAPASGAPAPGSAHPRSHVSLRVSTPDRTATYRVQGHPYLNKGATFDELLYDDGTHGDEKSGDSVYSIRIDIPGDFATLEYLYLRDGEPEFKPLPPLSSSIGDRLVALSTETVGPVDVFGESYLMAERAHPNKDGAANVARLVAERVQALPSFARFVGAAH